MAEKKSPAHRVAFWCVRAVFRAMPMTGDMRDRARDLAIRKFGPWLGHVAVPVEREHVEPGNSSRQLRLRADEAAIGHVPYRQQPLPASLPARLVAFYRIGGSPAEASASPASPWLQVAGALPQFEGHLQPRLPGSLGFYEPGNPALLRRQARLAAEYGLEAFCFQIDGAVPGPQASAFLGQWLADDRIALSFCLYCNHTPVTTPSSDLTGTGSGAVGNDDAIDFLPGLVDPLRHPRALRVDGKPVLLVRHALALPAPALATARWREWLRHQGVEAVHLVAVQADAAADPGEEGFDAAIQLPWEAPGHAADLTARQHLLNPGFCGQVRDWRDLAGATASVPPARCPCHPALCTGGDTEPLHPGSGDVLAHGSPRGYRQWLGDTVHRQLAPLPAQQRLVFINAWNDWANGALLEPDARLGHAWLEATRQALLHPQPATPPQRPCVVIHAWYPDVFAEILQALKDSGMAWRIVVTTPDERAGAIEAIARQSGLSLELCCWPNHGRDILPFLQVAERLLEEGEDIVLKLHTKRSPHLENGEQWRRELVASLLSESRAKRIFAAFRQDPHLGLVPPEGHVLNLVQDMGANERNLSGLLRRTGYLDEIGSEDCFIAGSMFWLRLAAIRPLLDAHLSPSLFEPEAGQVDGTLAHAVERCFTLLARQAGFRQVDAAELTGEEPRSTGMTLLAHRRS